MVDFLSKTAGEVVGKGLGGVGQILDDLFTSDEEKLDKKLAMERLRQIPYLAQIDLNKIEAQHKSIFVAGWRPWIGWVGGVALAWVALVEPWVEWYVRLNHPDVEIPAMDPIRLDFVFNILFAILGVNIGARTFEKIKGVSTDKL